MTNGSGSPADSQAAADSITTVLYHEEYHPPFLPALAILPFLLPLFWRYSVTVDSDQVVFGYSSGLTRKCIDRSNILSAEPIDHVNGLLQWGGWGIRMKLTFDATGYIAKNGPAVRIKTRDAETYVFNCKDPQLVCDLVSPREAQDSGILPLIS